MWHSFGLLIFIWIILNGCPGGVAPMGNICHPHSLQLSRIGETDISHKSPSAASATALVKGHGESLFVCLAVPTGTGETSIECQLLSSDIALHSDRFFTAATVEGKVESFEILNRKKFTVLVAVISRALSVLFVCHPQTDGTLEMVQIAHVGTRGATQYSLLHTRQGLAIFSARSSLCLDKSGYCSGEVPPVDLILDEKHITCESGEFGVSMAVAAWVGDGVTYVVHALLDEENEKTTVLRTYKLTNSTKLSHCSLKAVGSLPLHGVCGVQFMKVFRSWGQHFLLISSSHCDGRIFRNSASTRNLFAVLWNPALGRFDGDSVTRLSGTAQVTNLAVLSASTFLLERSLGLPSVIYCLGKKLNSSEPGFSRRDAISITPVVEMVAPSDSRLSITATSVLNNNHGKVYLARSLTSENAGRCANSSNVRQSTVIVDRLACPSVRFHQHERDGWEPTSKQQMVHNDTLVCVSTCVDAMPSGPGPVQTNWSLPHHPKGPAPAQSVSVPVLLAGTPHTVPRFNATRQADFMPRSKPEQPGSVQSTPFWSPNRASRANRTFVAMEPPASAGVIYERHNATLSPGRDKIELGIAQRISLRALKMENEYGDLYGSLVDYDELQPPSRTHSAASPLQSVQPGRANATSPVRPQSPPHGEHPRYKRGACINKTLDAPDAESGPFSGLMPGSLRWLDDFPDLSTASTIKLDMEPGIFFNGSAGNSDLDLPDYPDGGQPRLQRIPRRNVTRAMNFNQRPVTPAPRPMFPINRTQFIRKTAAHSPALPPVQRLPFDNSLLVNRGPTVAGLPATHSSAEFLQNHEAPPRSDQNGAPHDHVSAQRDRLFRPQNFSLPNPNPLRLVDDMETDRLVHSESFDTSDLRSADAYGSMPTPRHPHSIPSNASSAVKDELQFHPSGIRFNNLTDSEGFRARMRFFDPFPSDRPSLPGIPKSRRKQPLFAAKERQKVSPQNMYVFGDSTFLRDIVSDDYEDIVRITPPGLRLDYVYDHLEPSAELQETPAPVGPILSAPGLRYDDHSVTWSNASLPERSFVWNASQGAVTPGGGWIQEVPVPAHVVPHFSGLLGVQYENGSMTERLKATSASAFDDFRRNTPPAARDLGAPDAENSVFFNYQAAPSSPVRLLHNETLQSYDENLPQPYRNSTGGLSYGSNEFSDVPTSHVFPIEVVGPPPRIQHNETYTGVDGLHFGETVQPSATHIPRIPPPQVTVPHFPIVMRAAASPPRLPGIFFDQTFKGVDGIFYGETLQVPARMYTSVPGSQVTAAQGKLDLSLTGATFLPGGILYNQTFAGVDGISYTERFAHDRGSDGAPGQPILPVGPQPAFVPDLAVKSGITYNQKFRGTNGIFYGKFLPAPERTYAPRFPGRVFAAETALNPTQAGKTSQPARIFYNQSFAGFDGIHYGEKITPTPRATSPFFHFPVPFMNETHTSEAAQPYAKLGIAFNQTFRGVDGISYDERFPSAEIMPLLITPFTQTVLTAGESATRMPENLDFLAPGRGIKFNQTTRGVDGISYGESSAFDALRPSAAPFTLRYQSAGEMFHTVAPPIPLLYNQTFRTVDGISYTEKLAYYNGSDLVPAQPVPTVQQTDPVPALASSNNGIAFDQTFRGVDGIFYGEFLLASETAYAPVLVSRLTAGKAKFAPTQAGFTSQPTGISFDQTFAGVEGIHYGEKFASKHHATVSPLRFPVSLTKETHSNGGAQPYENLGIIHNQTFRGIDGIAYNEKFPSADKTPVFTTPFATAPLVFAIASETSERLPPGRGIKFDQSVRGVDGIFYGESWPVDRRSSGTTAILHPQLPSERFFTAAPHLPVLYNQTFRGVDGIAYTEQFAYYNGSGARLAAQGVPVVQQPVFLPSLAYSKNGITFDQTFRGVDGISYRESLPGDPSSGNAEIGPFPVSALPSASSVTRPASVFYGQTFRGVDGISYTENIPFTNGTGMDGSRRNSDNHVHVSAESALPVGTGIRFDQTFRGIDGIYYGEGYPTAARDAFSRTNLSSMARALEIPLENLSVPVPIRWNGTVDMFGRAPFKDVAETGKISQVVTLSSSEDAIRHRFFYNETFRGIDDVSHTDYFGEAPGQRLNRTEINLESTGHKVQAGVPQHPLPVASPVQAESLQYSDQRSAVFGAATPANQTGSQNVRYNQTALWKEEFPGIWIRQNRTAARKIRKNLRFGKKFRGIKYEELGHLSDRMRHNETLAQSGQSSPVQIIYQRTGPADRVEVPLRFPNGIRYNQTFRGVDGIWHGDATTQTHGQFGRRRSSVLQSQSASYSPEPFEVRHYASPLNADRLRHDQDLHGWLFSVPPTEIDEKPARLTAGRLRLHNMTTGLAERLHYSNESFAGDRIFSEAALQSGFELPPVNPQAMAAGFPRVSPSLIVPSQFNGTFLKRVFHDDTAVNSGRLLHTDTTDRLRYVEQTADIPELTFPAAGNAFPHGLSMASSIETGTGHRLLHSRTSDRLHFGQRLDSGHPEKALSDQRRVPPLQPVVNQTAARAPGLSYSDSVLLNVGIHQTETTDRLRYGETEVTEAVGLLTPHLFFNVADLADSLPVVGPARVRYNQTSDGVQYTEILGDLSFRNSTFPNGLSVKPLRRPLHPQDFDEQVAGISGRLHYNDSTDRMQFTEWHQNTDATYLPVRHIIPMTEATPGARIWAAANQSVTSRSFHNGTTDRLHYGEKLGTPESYALPTPPVLRHPGWDGSEVLSQPQENRVESSEDPGLISGDRLRFSPATDRLRFSELVGWTTAPDRLKVPDVSLLEPATPPRWISTELHLQQLPYADGTDFGQRLLHANGTTERMQFEETLRASEFAEMGVSRNRSDFFQFLAPLEALALVTQVPYVFEPDEVEYATRMRHNETTDRLGHVENLSLTKLPVRRNDTLERQPGGDVLPAVYSDLPSADQFSSLTNFTTSVLHGAAGHPANVTVRLQHDEPQAVFDRLSYVNSSDISQLQFPGYPVVPDSPSDALGSLSKVPFWQREFGTSEPDGIAWLSKPEESRVYYNYSELQQDRMRYNESLGQSHPHQLPLSNVSAPADNPYREVSHGLLPVLSEGPLAERMHYNESGAIAERLRHMDHFQHEFGLHSPFDGNQPPASEIIYSEIPDVATDDDLQNTIDFMDGIFQTFPPEKQNFMPAVLPKILSSVPGNHSGTPDYRPSHVHSGLVSRDREERRKAQQFLNPNLYGIHRDVRLENDTENSDDEFFTTTDSTVLPSDVTAPATLASSSKDQDSAPDPRRGINYENLLDEYEETDSTINDDLEIRSGPGSPLGETQELDKASMTVDVKRKESTNWTLLSKQTAPTLVKKSETAHKLRLRLDKENGKGYFSPQDDVKVTIKRKKISVVPGNIPNSSVQNSIPPQWLSQPASRRLRYDSEEADYGDYDDSERSKILSQMSTSRSSHVALKARYGRNNNTRLIQRLPLSPHFNFSAGNMRNLNHSTSEMPSSGKVISHHYVRKIENSSMSSVLDLSLSNLTKDDGKDLQSFESVNVNLTSVNDDLTTSQSVKLKLVRMPKMGPLAEVCDQPMRLDTRRIFRHVECRGNNTGISVKLSASGGSGMFHYTLIEGSNRDIDEKFSLDSDRGDLLTRVPIWATVAHPGTSQVEADQEYDIPVKIHDEICDEDMNAVVSVTYVCRAGWRKQA